MIYKPFAGRQTNLIHLASGFIASDAVLQTRSVKKDCFMPIVNKNTPSDSPELFAAIKKVTRKNFYSDLKPVKTSIPKGIEMSLKSSRCARALLLTKNRDIEMKEVCATSLDLAQ